jgi:hypothetical protein
MSFEEATTKAKALSLIIMASILDAAHYQEAV